MRRTFSLAGFALLMVTALVACTPPNKPPVASFTVTPASGDTTTSFTFDASASSDPDPDGEIASYEWDFGDDSEPVTTEEPTTTHTYAAAGSYTVTLTVTDDKGATASATQEVMVSVPMGTVSGYVVNRKAGTAVEGATVALEGGTASATTDADGFYSLPVPTGDVTLTFNKEGYAESKAVGLRVAEDEETEYSTILPELFDPFLPVEAPTLDVSVANGDTLTGVGDEDSFSFTISGEVAEPDVNGFVFASAGLGQSRGNSGFLNISVPGVPLGFDGGELEVVLFATGFEGETTLHVVAYDLNYNRTEVIRYVTVDSSLEVGETLATPEELSALAVTFGDASTFGPLGVGSGVNARSILEAVRAGDTKALQEQARILEEAGRGLKPQQQNPLDEVVTWVELVFSYDLSSADPPTAFQIYRQLENEDDFRLIGQVSPLQAVIDPDNGVFLYVDSTPALQAGLTATYRVDAVLGDERESSGEASTTPLPPFYVSADAPADNATDVPLTPTYEMSFTNRSNLVYFGVVVLDRVHADNFVEWLFAFFLDDSGETEVAIPHNLDGSATLPSLQPFHAYDWQPIAITTNGEIVMDDEGNFDITGETAVAIGADFFDVFGFGFPISDGPVNTFVTGDDSN